MVTVTGRGDNPMYSIHFAYISVNPCYPSPVRRWNYCSWKVSSLPHDGSWDVDGGAGRFNFSQNGKKNSQHFRIYLIFFYELTLWFAKGNRWWILVVFSSSFSWAQLENQISANNGLYVSSMELPLMGFLMFPWWSSDQIRCVIP